MSPFVRRRGRRTGPLPAPLARASASVTAAVQTSPIPPGRLALASGIPPNHFAMLFDSHGVPRTKLFEDRLAKLATVLGLPADVPLVEEVR